MPTTDPRIFDGQQLVPEATYPGAVNDFAIHCAGHLVGRIMRADLSGGAESWMWTVTGPYLPPELQPSDGRTGTIAEAKAAFRAKFDEWQAWAREQAEPVSWHGG